MINGGSASFESPLYYPSSHIPDEVDTADLNGDGRPDVIATSTLDHGLTVHLNVCLH
jgi:hypothetical protein